MNNNIRKFLYRNKNIISILSKLLRFKNENKYFDEVINREKLDIFNYIEIAKELPYYPFDNIADNNLYGISYCLKKYFGIPLSIDLNAYIEHGVYFGNYISKDTNISYPQNIITVSPQREVHLKLLSKKKIKKIGPYILYAKPILTNIQFVKLKEELGKVLLVFPSHSVKGLKSLFDIDSLIQVINENKIHYDSVLVCLYYLDTYDNEITKKYLENNFRIVCAGHKYDYNFLSRLRSIIELADHTISNNVGTHIGYCGALNKTHQIFPQKINYRGWNSNEKNIRSENEKLSYQIEIEEVESFFSLPIDIQPIHKKKYILEKYFGCNCSVANLHDII